MENLFDLEGGSLDCRVFSTSSDLTDKLITSLTSFIRLYSRGRGHVQASSARFMLTAAQLRKTHDDISENWTVRGLFIVFGGVLGAASGGVTGGVCGALGAVGAAACRRFCSDINAVGATVGLVGSVLGGVAGGAFGGAVGSAVGAAGEATGHPVQGVVSDVAWFIVGFGTGVAIGGTFGRTVGAAGGAIGGAFGALCSTRFAVSLVGGAIGYFCGTKDSKEQKMESKKLNAMLSGGEFREAVKPLVDELKTIKTISDKMAASVFVQSAAGQTAETLAAVTTMEEMILQVAAVSDLPQFVSSVEEAARQSRKITKELETTRGQVEKLLVSLRKH